MRPPPQIELLTRRLERLVQMFAEDFGADVTTIPGGGAAGGLGGALAALGGRLLPGFELVADELDLYDQLDGADLIITGEGRLDDTSFAGKVVGGIASIAADADVPVLAVVGSIDDTMSTPHPAGLTTTSVTDVVGADLAFDRTEAQRRAHRARLALGVARRLNARAAITVCRQPSTR